MCWTQRGKHVSQGTRLFASSLAALHSRAAPLPKLAGRQPVQAALPVATSEPSCRRCVVRPARKFPLSLRLHADASLRTPCCRCQDEQALFLAHGLASCKASSWVLAVERAASAKLSEWLHFALRCGDRGARSRRFPRSPSRHRCSLQADIQARCVHPPHTSQARPQSADRACETHLAGLYEQSGTLIIMRSAMSCERDLINLTSILSNAVQAAIHEQSQDGRQCGERERERESGGVATLDVMRSGVAMQLKPRLSRTCPLPLCLRTRGPELRRVRAASLAPRPCLGSFWQVVASDRLS